MGYACRYAAATASARVASEHPIVSCLGHSSPGPGPSVYMSAGQAQRGVEEVALFRGRGKAGRYTYMREMCLPTERGSWGNAPVLD